MSKKNTFKFGIVLCVLLVFTLAMASSLLIQTNEVCHGASVDFKSVGKASCLVDVKSGYVLYERNQNERLPIASMVKIMTTLLAFEAVDNGDISLDDDVTISENSAGMGGSQVFLDAGSTHKVSELLKSIIVASANDSCVAIAEHICGSTERFVARMNERAKSLGMNNTQFKNCTGLPCAESFSCAKDVATMFAKLIEHPIYFEFAKIWLEDYVHPDGRVTTITNTNKLVRFYNGCDGGKTGFTSEAKFCLSATAKRDNMRVIAVVIGADSSKIRNGAVSAMFDYAFANFTNEIMLKAGEKLDIDVEVISGKQGYVAVGAEKDLTRFVAHDDTAKYDVKFEVAQSVKAPIKEGEVLGKAHLVKDGVVVDSVNIVAIESVEGRSYFDSIGEIAKNWATQKK